VTEAEINSPLETPSDAKVGKGGRKSPASRQTHLISLANDRLVGREGCTDRRSVWTRLEESEQRRSFLFPGLR